MLPMREKEKRICRMERDREKREVLPSFEGQRGDDGSKTTLFN